MMFKVFLLNGGSNRLVSCLDQFAKVLSTANHVTQHGPHYRAGLVHVREEHRLAGCNAYLA